MIGGEGYRWIGKDIRQVSHKRRICVSMPRKTSVVRADCKIEPGELYQFSIKACGNGKVDFWIKGAGKQEVCIVAPDFSIFSFQVDMANVSAKNVKAEVLKKANSIGNVYIQSISYKKINRPIEITPEQVEAEKKAKLEKERLARRKDISKTQSYAEKQYKEEQEEYLAIARGTKMGKFVKIGGKGHRWKGRAIKGEVRGGTNCVVLSGRGAAVLAKTNVPPSSTFEVIVRAYGPEKGKGNGKVLVNFFGGKKYDGAPVAVNVNGSGLGSYVLKVNTPDFPRSIPMHLRVWRPSGAAGSITIKEIEYRQIKSETSKVFKQSSKHPQPKPRPKPKVKRPPLTKEDKILIGYRSIALSARTTEKAKEILINDPNMVPRVSIITPTRDGAGLLRKCYDALVKNTAYPNWEWIVGDSQSEDDTEEYMRSIKDPRVKFIQRGTTDGSFSSINNELAEYATGEYFLFLNNDTEPQPFWLFEMMSKIHRHPKIGVVGARLMHGEKRVQHAGIAFSPQGPANIGKPLLKSLGGEAYYKQDRFYQAVTGACMLMRKSDFNKVGKFDPIYYFCYEDVDLCLKVRYDLGKQVLYAANAIVRHAESVTQKKHGTGGPRQRAGIDAFKRKWMGRVEIDLGKYQKDKKRGLYPVQASFVTCVNNMRQYLNFVVGSLFLSDTKKNYEIIPIFNFSNQYSAAQALNMGIDEARAEVVVCCHQDVAFYKEWVDQFFGRIKEIEKQDRRWGVLGVAGIDKRDHTVGVVNTVKGKLQWRHTVSTPVYPIQTADECCVALRKSSGLKFDQGTFKGFHFYAVDLCLNASSKKMTNYGILCPLIHETGSGSLRSGKEEFMRYLNALAKKWRYKYKKIRTTTSIINGNSVRTFIKF